MARGFGAIDQQHWDVSAVTPLKRGVCRDVDLTELERLNLPGAGQALFDVVAEVTTGSCVKGELHARVTTIATLSFRVRAQLPVRLPAGRGPR